MKRFKQQFNAPRERHCSIFGLLGDIFGFGGGGGEDAALQAARISGGATTRAATLESKAIKDAAARLAIAGPAAGEIQAQGALTAADLQALGITGLAGERELAATQGVGLQQAGVSEAINELRRQFGVTQDIFSPFLQAGTGALGDLQQGATVGGFDARLAELANTDIFGTLAAERGRAAQGQFAAGGLTRSGTGLAEAARVPTEILLGIESQLQGRLQSLASTGLSAAGDIGQFGATSSQNIARLLQQQGLLGAQGVRGAAEARGQGVFGVQQALGQGVLGASGARAAGLLAGVGAQAEGLTGAARVTAEGIRGAGQIQGQGILTGQQASAAATQNTLNTALAVAQIAFSDPNLKENINVIEMVKVPRGTLEIVEWDWIPEAPGMVKVCPTMGFLSTQVKDLYPEYVGEFGGFDVIFYQELFDHLRIH